MAVRLVPSLSLPSRGSSQEFLSFFSLVPRRGMLTLAVSRDSPPLRVNSLICCPKFLNRFIFFTLPCPALPLNTSFPMSSLVSSLEASVSAEACCAAAETKCAAARFKVMSGE
uniref:Uncharacterized protein n=1 Tax=Cacopsylla melanoneura TaxID=428564 RepID=A0A8D8WV33_9HEMI